MSRKLALIIGNTEYTDPGLAQLTAPGKDAEDLARIFKDKDIGAFDDVKIVVNEPSASVIEAIDEFFDQKKPEDMLVLYFSGHGIRDEIGSLYLAFKNTIRSRLRSTAIKSDYIKEAMDQSRSKRQVLILDCCNSGAFPQGTKAELGGAMGLTQAFQGYGRFVLTASDATQFAWEGDKVIGETDNSLFTHFLVKGLEGEADSDGDGKITVDELYDYAYKQISSVTPKQTPTKSASKQEGEIVLRQNMRIENIKPVNLPDDLIEEMEDHRPYVREAAVQKLEKILKGKNLGMARSAAEALEKIANDENTTRRVSQVATEVLESYKQALQKADEERLAKSNLDVERLTEEKRLADEAERQRLARAKLEAERLAEEKRRADEAEKRQLAAKKAEEERVAKAKLEAERLAEEKRLSAQKADEERIATPKLEAERITEERVVADRLLAKELVEEESSVLTKPNPSWNHAWWITLGWALCFGILYNFAEEGPGALFGGFISGGIVGLTLRQGKIISKISGVLILAIGMSISNLTFTAITIIMDFDTALFASLAAWGAVDGLIMSFVLRKGQIPLSGKSTLWILLGWASGYLASFTIRGFFPSGLWGVIDGGIAGAIGGFVMIWQIREELKKK